MLLIFITYTRLGLPGAHCVMKNDAANMFATTQILNL